MGSSKDDSSLDPLRKTLGSLKEIRTNLFPFLKFLKEDTCESGQSRSSGKKHSLRGGDCADTDITNVSKGLHLHRRAEAEAAVALVIGTLRYMGARLSGLDRGRKKGDPLRMELDKIRGTLVKLRKIEGEFGGGNVSSKVSDVGKAKSEITISTQSYDCDRKERNKFVDTSASQRMIKAALENDSKKPSKGEESTPHRKKPRR
mmetsp:Transcript_26696/g.56228  ORF Transcript_26696/g.56228 Transcript_26696/m.56228 type:complete len:203 (-) Transcript_26696:44-652(-)